MTESRGGIWGGSHPPPLFTGFAEILLEPIPTLLYRYLIRSPLRQGGFGGIEPITMGFPQLFRRRSRAKKREKEDVTETFRTLIDARFDRLESSFRLLRGEWEDAYEKLSLLYDRSRKRLKVIEKASGEETTIEPVQTLPPTKEDILRAYIAQNGA